MDINHNFDQSGKDRAEPPRLTEGERCYLLLEKLASDVELTPAEREELHLYQELRIDPTRPSREVLEAMAAYNAGAARQLLIARTAARRSMYADS